MPTIIRTIKTKFSLIPAVTWGFLILYLTLRPKSDADILSLPSWLKVLPIDKVAHFGFWGIWFLLYGKFYLKRNEYANDNPRKTIDGHFRKERNYGIAVMIIVGGLVEVAQYLLKWGREAELADLVADIIGVLAAALLFRKP